MFRVFLVPEPVRMVVVEVEEDVVVEVVEVVV